MKVFMYPTISYLYVANGLISLRNNFSKGYVDKLNLRNANSEPKMHISEFLYIHSQELLQWNLEEVAGKMPLEPYEMCMEVTCSSLLPPSWC